MIIRYYCSKGRRMALLFWCQRRKNLKIGCAFNLVKFRKWITVKENSGKRKNMKSQLRYPALPGLICNLLNILFFGISFQKCFLQLLGFQASQAQGVGGRGQTCTKTFLGQVEMCVENFIKIGEGVWISNSPPNTNRQTDKPTNHFFQYFNVKWSFRDNFKKFTGGIGSMKHCAPVCQLKSSAEFWKCDLS